MDFMLDEKVDERDEGAEETSRDDFTVFQCSWVERGHGDDSQCPWQSAHQIPDHGDIMETMIIGRRDIDPSSTEECSQYANEGNDFWQRSPSSSGK
jgi:hypothetical protein